MKFPVSAEMKTWFAARGQNDVDEIEIDDSALPLLEQHRTQAKRYKGWGDAEREDWALWVTYTHVAHGGVPTPEPLTKPQPATLVDQIQNARLDELAQTIASPVPVDLKKYEVEWYRPPNYAWVGWVTLGALTALQTFFIYGIWAHFGR